MKIPPTLSHTLAAAIGLALLGGAPVTDATTVSGRQVADHDQGARTLVVFGDPMNVEHAGDLIAARRRSTVLDGGALTDADIDRLARPDAQAIAVVAARQLADLGDAGGALMRAFQAGMPVFVCADGDETAQVARVFGIAPSSGDAIYVRDPDGGVAVIGHTEGKAHWTPAWSRKTSASLAKARQEATAAPAASVAALGRSMARVQQAEPAPATEQASSLPMVVFHQGTLNMGSEEITGFASIKVIRTATLRADLKEIHVHTRPSITPRGAGIYRGANQRPKVNLTAAYLPWTYRVGHKVFAAGANVQLVDSLPASDANTTINYEKKKTRVFNVGGDVAQGASSDGKPSAGLAAKLPFNLSFSYSNTLEETISYAFRDYSMQARPVEGNSRMLWEAPINTRLKNVLVQRVRADSVEMSEKEMTPMMRTATFDTWSAWTLPGNYEGIATVEVDAGYDRNEKTWWWRGPDFQHAETTKPVAAKTSYRIDMSHPFLTREITVLIRSAHGNGGCISAKGGEVVLATCNAADRAQMWGLDSERRYVNRSDGRCLKADRVSLALRTAPCSLDNDQAWEWRADRLHSGFDDGRDRLFVDNGKIRFRDAAGRFGNILANPHHPVLNPWSGYPKAPVVGELIPAPYGVVPGVVRPEMAAGQGAVGSEQRWNIVVLRHGLDAQR